MYILRHRGRMNFSLNFAMEFSEIFAEERASRPITYEENSKLRARGARAPKIKFRHVKKVPVIAQAPICRYSLVLVRQQISKNVKTKYVVHSA
jgi:hypothetical protein